MPTSVGMTNGVVRRVGIHAGWCDPLAGMTRGKAVGGGHAAGHALFMKCTSNLAKFAPLGS
jgi:hypothetical protein